MVQVKIAEGILEGMKVKNPYGGSFFSFKGIPYAEPPIGELRFKAPQPLMPWDGVRSAKEHGPNCLQYDVFIKNVTVGTEDCLYLNVYSPDIKPDKPLPVMVFIHGGDFMCGSGDVELYGPELLVKKDVILVTINYRLEVLGFISLENEDIPGNAGMKDQVAALRWVKKNINNFGGDPDNVTIFGESAGGASVTFHLVSPMSKGLFNRAIAQSGAATNNWAISYQPRQRALNLAKKLGCYSEDDKELYEFFKSQPAQNLCNHKLPLTFKEATWDFDDVTFAIVEEKQFGDNEVFFSKNVYENLRNGIHEGVQVMGGYCEEEGLLSLGMRTNLETMFHQCNNFLEVFAPKDIILNCPLGTVLEVGRKVKKFYFGDEEVTMDHIEQKKKYLSMAMFVYGIVQWHKFTSLKNKTYLYKFTCKSERNFLGKIMGLDRIVGDRTTVCHADDLPYLFTSIYGTDPNPETWEMVDNVTTLWTNFAKYGNPTPDSSLGVEWEPFCNQHQRYLDIGNQLVPGSHPEKEELEFWESIFTEHLPHYLVPIE